MIVSIVVFNKEYLIEFVVQCWSRGIALGGFMSKRKSPFRNFAEYF